MIPTVPAERMLDADLARYWMAATFRQGCAAIDAFVAEMGGWEAMPSRFEIGGKAWEEAEGAISNAAYAGRWWETVALGDEYLRRIKSFCDGWRTVASKAKGASR